MVEKLRINTVKCLMYLIFHMYYGNSNVIDWFIEIMPVLSVKSHILIL